MTGQRTRETNQLLAVGWAEKVGILNARLSQDRVGPNDLGLVKGVRMANHPDMCEAMIAYLVPVGENLPDGGVLTGDRAAD
jgi:hypothetical protein